MSVRLVYNISGGGAWQWKCVLGIRGDCIHDSEPPVAKHSSFTLSND